MDTVVSILQAALGIGFLIFIHEAGHFLAARLAGVRVEVFSLGFGPRLLGFRRSGTEYRLALVPVGGYVRVRGEDPTQRNHLPPDSLYAKGYSARALFFAGGVIMNLLFALIAFPLVFRAGVPFTAPVVGAVEPGGAAWVAGIEPGDRVLRVDGKEMYSFENLLVEVALAGGRDPVGLEIERSGAVRSAQLTPRYSGDRGLFGIGIDPAIDDGPIPVVAVDRGSPAERAGLRAGDRIVAIGGATLRGAPAHAALRELESRPGQQAVLDVERSGRTERIEFRPEPIDGPAPRLGVVSAAREIVAVREHPVVDELGLRRGDRVVSIDGRDFGRPSDEDFAGAGPVRMVVLRGGEELTLQADLTTAERKALREALAFGPETGEVRVVALPGTPAQRAGVPTGSRVLALDGQPIVDWADLVAAVEAAAAEPVLLKLESGGGEIDIRVAPERPQLADLGFERLVEQRRDIYRVESVGAAIGAGMTASIDLIKQMYVTLKRIATGDVSARNLGGIVTISRVSYSAAQGGWTYFVWFLALLSINLAFINVLPIPVLDGGHLMFLLIERIKGSPVSAEVVNYSQILGLVFVIALMIFVTYNDILRLL